MLSLLTVYLLLLCFLRKAYSVPPDACFAKFRWQDCGKPPTPVMYYWKSGSRCEVGLWRGCLPNPNMFKDEYECVATCIFASRARSEDFHNYNEVIPMTDIAETDTTLDGNSTADGNTTESDSNSTEVTTGNGETGVTEDGKTGATGADGAEDGKATAGGDKTGEATTAGETTEGGDEAAPAVEGAETTTPAEAAAADDAPPAE